MLLDRKGSSCGSIRLTLQYNGIREAKVTILRRRESAHVEGTCFDFGSRILSFGRWASEWDVLFSLIKPNRIHHWCSVETINSNQSLHPMRYNLWAVCLFRVKVNIGHQHDSEK